MAALFVLLTFPVEITDRIDVDTEACFPKTRVHVGTDVGAIIEGLVNETVLSVEARIDDAYREVLGVGDLAPVIVQQVTEVLDLEVQRALPGVVKA